MSTTPRCPICRLNHADDAHAPFCSARCRDLDMGRWLSGAYRMPTQETAPEPPPSEPENGDSPR